MWNVDLLGNSNIGTEREACPIVTIYKIKIKEEIYYIKIIV